MLKLSGRARALLIEQAWREAKRIAHSKDIVVEIGTPTNDDELMEYLLNAWGIQIPDVQVCEHHTTPWRAFSDAFFARHDVVVWKASRGLGGKSFMLATLGMTEAASLGADVNVLGGSGSQSRNVHKYMRQMWDSPSAPIHLLASDATWHTKFKQGNEIVALTASQGSVRGPHVQRLRLDEIDEMSLEILDASLGQPMENKGIKEQVVLSSTHQYPNGTMTQVISRANEKRWPIYEWCYKESMAQGEGWLSDAQVKRKQRQVTKRMWQVEFELQEPAPEASAIDVDKVQSMFDISLGDFSGAIREYIEIEPPMLICEKCADEIEDPLPDLVLKLDTVTEQNKIISEYQRNKIKCEKCSTDDNDVFYKPAKYATGADWARKKDFTAIATNRIDCKPYKLVAYERTTREPWPTMVGKYEKRLKRFHSRDGATKRSVHDGTGVGDVVDGYLHFEAEAFIMAGRDRRDLFTEYINAIENNEYTAPMVQSLKNEHLYVEVDDLYGSGHPPDGIVAMALSHRAASRPLGVLFK